MFTEVLIIGGLATMGVGGWYYLKSRKAKKPEELAKPNMTFNSSPTRRPIANNTTRSESTRDSSTTDFLTGAVLGSLIDSGGSSSRASESSWSGSGGTSDGGGSSYSYSSSDSGSSYSSSNDSGSSSGGGGD